MLIMDEDISKRIESILGKNLRIIDCEKTSSVREEELLLINGIPVQLDGDDGNAIKSALISGQVPPCDLLNQLLFQAGILQQPVQLESTISVKSSLITKEDIKIAKDGKILNEKSHETCEQQYISSLSDEIWEPMSSNDTKKIESKICNSTTNHRQIADDSFPLTDNDTDTVDNINIITASSSPSKYQFISPKSRKKLKIGENINKIPFKNTKRDQADYVITSSSVRDKISIPIDSKMREELEKNLNHNVKNLKSIASIKSKPKIESSSSSSIFDSVEDTPKDYNSTFCGGYNDYNIESLSSRVNTQPSKSSTSSTQPSYFYDQNLQKVKSSSSSNTTIDDDQSSSLKDVQNINFDSVLSLKSFSNDTMPDGTLNPLVSLLSNTDNNDDSMALMLKLASNSNSSTTATDDIFSFESEYCHTTKEFNRDSSALRSNSSCLKSNNFEEKKYLPNISNTMQHGSTNPAGIGGSGGADDKINPESVSELINTLSLSSTSFSNPNQSSHSDTCNCGSLFTNYCLFDNSSITNYFTKSDTRNAHLQLNPNVTKEAYLFCTGKSAEANNSTTNKSELKNKEHEKSLLSSDECAKSISEGKIDQNRQSKLPKTTTTVIDEKLLVYRDGILISGPLESLIKHMVPTSDYYPEDSFVFAFLLSARLFINPYQLLERICQLCEEQQNFIMKTQTQVAQKKLTIQKSSTSKSISSHNHQENVKPVVLSSTSTSSGGDNLLDTKRNLQKFAKNFLRLLSEWVNAFPYDFRDERLMQQVRTMQQKCILIDSTLRENVSEILQKLLEKLTSLEKYENFLSSIEQETIDTNFINGVLPSSHAIFQLSSSSVGSNTSSGIKGIEIIEICPSSLVLAQQLTHIELEKLSHIGPEEFVQVFAKENYHLIGSSSNANAVTKTSVQQKQKKSDQSSALLQQSHNSSTTTSNTVGAYDIKKTRNLETYVHWFNRLSYLVATEIVKYPKKKFRARAIEYWIETARECFNIGNFNSLMAIIAGLNMSAISRLKKTWAKVQLAKFSVLEHQMDPSSNFNSYRLTLKAAMWRSAGATNERERIIIPFFSLLLKDLYFLNEGCSNRLPNGHINFEKFWQVSKQIKEFMSWKDVVCPFEKDNKTIIYLQTCPLHQNENSLAIASFECEPPENVQEKERFKELKVEALQQI